MTVHILTLKSCLYVHFTPQSPQQLVQAESSAAKSTALGVLPFALSAEVHEQLEAFKSESDACNWVEMTIVNEVITLVGFRTVTAEESLQSYIDSESAR